MGEPVRDLVSDAPGPDAPGPDGTGPGVAGLGDQAREAILRAIIRAAAKVGNSPTGVRDLAEAYALLERDLVPRSSVVHNKT
jgi:hypothetical protein